MVKELLTGLLIRLVSMQGSRVAQTVFAAPAKTRQKKNERSQYRPAKIEISSALSLCSQT